MTRSGDDLTEPAQSARSAHPAVLELFDENLPGIPMLDQATPPLFAAQIVRTTGLSRSCALEGRRQHRDRRLAELGLEVVAVELEEGMAAPAENACHRSTTSPS